MTADEAKARLAEIAKEEESLRMEKYPLVLVVEEAEGRAGSFEARFARAAIAGDHRAMTTLCAESDVDYLRRYGEWPGHDVRDVAEKILAARARGEEG